MYVCMYLSLLHEQKKKKMLSKYLLNFNWSNGDC